MAGEKMELISIQVLLDAATVRRHLRRIQDLAELVVSGRAPRSMIAEWLDAVVGGPYETEALESMARTAATFESVGPPMVEALGEDPDGFVWAAIDEGGPGLEQVRVHGAYHRFLTPAGRALLQDADARKRFCGLWHATARRGEMHADKHVGAFSSRWLNAAARSQLMFLRNVDGGRWRDACPDYQAAEAVYRLASRDRAPERLVEAWRWPQFEGLLEPWLYVCYPRAGLIDLGTDEPDDPLAPRWYATDAERLRPRAAVHVEDLGAPGGARR